MSVLKFSLVRKDGHKHPLEFQARRLLLAGFTARNQEAAMKHVEELRSHGIAAPDKIPSYYPVPRDLVTTDEEIEVLGSSTSGEVEVVFLFQGGTIYVGVGSDHTDRDLEKVSIAKSKVMCSKVLSKELWNYEEIKAGWDRLILRSWIEEGREKRLYQEGPMNAFLEPEELIRLTREQTRDGDLRGMALFLGTLPTLQKGFVFSNTFEGELIDESLRRRLSFRYRVSPIDLLSNKVS
ncbi:MAG: DUF2848 family protein [Candidatus Binatia bacterium]